MSLLLSQLGDVPVTNFFGVVAQTAGPQFSKTVLYQSYATDAKFSFEAPVTVDKWFAHLSEPVRQKRGERPQRQQFIAFHDRPIVSFGWYEPLTDPVRIKRRTAHYQDRFIGLKPEVSFSWYRALDEPKRFKSTRWQHFLEFDPFPIAAPEDAANFRWYQAFSEPRRFRPAILAAQQQFYTTDPFPLPNPVFLNWFQALSEPKRFRPELKTSAHIFLAFDPNPIPTPPQRAQGGYLPYNEIVTLGWGAIRAYPQVTFDLAYETTPRGVPEPVAAPVIAAKSVSDDEKLRRYAEAAAAFDLDLVRKYLEAIGVDLDG